MLGCLVIVSLAGLCAGSVPVHHPKVPCYSYYDEAVKYKLSDSLHGYPESQIQEELVRRPFMRPVLYDHNAIQPAHKVYKRSYGHYGNPFNVEPFHRFHQFNPVPVRSQPIRSFRRQPVHPIQRKPVRPIHPKPVHPIHPKPVHPFHPKPVHQFHPKPVHPIHPKPVHPIHPQPVHPIHPKPGHQIHRKPVRPIHRKLVPVPLVSPVSHKYAKPIAEACPAKKYTLRKFWYYDGDCYVINPSYQKVTFAKCSGRDCSNCAYNGGKNYYDYKPVSKCVESYEKEYVWAYCYKHGSYTEKIVRVALSVPKYCSCKTYQC